MKEPLRAGNCIGFPWCLGLEADSHKWPLSLLHISAPRKRPLPSPVQKEAWEFKTRRALGSSPNLCLMCCATSVSHLPSLGSEASFCKASHHHHPQLCHWWLRLPHLPLRGALGPRLLASGPGGGCLLLLGACLRQSWPLSQPSRRFWPNLCCQIKSQMTPLWGEERKVQVGQVSWLVGATVFPGPELLSLSCMDGCWVADIAPPLFPASISLLRVVPDSSASSFSTSLPNKMERAGATSLVHTCATLP